MSDTTQIEWTHFPGYSGATWNPVVGCTKIATGCQNCYAKALHDKRHKAYLNGAALPSQYAQPFETVQLKPNRLDVPLRRRKPTCYFVNSVSDLFHADVPFEFIAACYGVMAACPQHLFIILTKRPARMRESMEWVARQPLAVESREQYDFIDGSNVVAEYVFPHHDAAPGLLKINYEGYHPAWPLPNVIHGMSASTQADLDAGIGDLLATPSALRCLSLEPLIGPITINAAHRYGVYDNQNWPMGGPPFESGPKLDWVIVGGERGPGARGYDVQWARSIIAQCAAAGVAAFHKQVGSKPYDSASVRVAGNTLDPECPHTGLDGLNGEERQGWACEGCGRWFLKDKKGGDMAEWSEDLRVRQFPEVERI